MDIKKGIFRIYLVISGLWFLGFTFIAFEDKNDFLIYMSIGIVTPIVIYILGKWIGKWIYEGFFSK
jgi:hypothetical protein|tara:strand:- start:493 stop:690 length:198 start_codon:yes stop_codon:yes gene_type:complete